MNSYFRCLKLLENTNSNLILQNVTKLILKSSSIRFVNTTKFQDGNLLNNASLLSLQNTLQDQNTPFSTPDWKTIRKDLIAKEKFINEINVDALILGLCNSSHHLEVAKSYVKFLKSQGFELNNASLGRLVKIYYFVYKSGQLTDKDKSDIIEIYESILRKHEILDSQTCENLIHGIIATHKWRNSLNLLDMIKLTCKPSTNAYSTIITRAFGEPDSDEDIAWKLLLEMIANNKQPKCEIFLSYLKRCTNNHKLFRQNIEKMFRFIEHNDILVSRAVAEEFQLVLKQYGVNAAITTLSRKGKCNSCKVHMKNVCLSSDEFHKLSSTFLDKVLIRKDVFLKSSPEEVDSFVEFIDRTAPYDCIIDGLNVAFSCGTKKNANVYASLLASVVKYFVQKSKKVLVIGRKHMDKWPKEQLMMYIKNNSSLFLTNNLSQDDPFLLYAALKSGPKTDFISRDFMRPHAFLLGPHLKPIFRRWQIEHQYTIFKANENGKVLIQEPIRHYLTAHKVYSTWHVPFRETYMVHPNDQFEAPLNWICISFPK